MARRIVTIERDCCGARCVWFFENEAWNGERIYRYTYLDKDDDFAQWLLSDELDSTQLDRKIAYKSFKAALKHLLELGKITQEEADQLWADFLERNPGIEDEFGDPIDVTEEFYRTHPVNIPEREYAERI
jgi:hypothetical protein